jgi:hypothetical protein
VTAYDDRKLRDLVRERMAEALYEIRHARSAR